MPTHFWWGPLGSSSCAVAISTSFSGFIVAALCRLCLYPGRCRCFFLWYPLRDNRSIPHTHCSCTEATLSRMCPDCIRISVILHIPVSNNDRIVASWFLVGWLVHSSGQTGLRVCKRYPVPMCFEWPINNAAEGGGFESSLTVRNIRE